MRNVEIKARIADYDAFLAKALALADKPAVTMETVDTFFVANAGRLKLREYSGSQQAELIHYSREDSAGAKVSEYSKCRVPDPASLRRVLADALGTVGTVAKRRTLLLCGQTRVHVDKVEGLGSFMELEVVLLDDQSVADGSSIADELMRRLGVEQQDLIACAYMDLLLQR